MHRWSRTALTVAALSSLVFPAVGAHAGVVREAEDVFGQGPGGPVVSEDGAELARADRGLGVKVTMPTPVPGTYRYPEGAEPGHPEAFSLWAFVFNFPDRCTDGRCDGDDLFAPGGGPARAGAFNVAGNVVGGPTLVLSGHLPAHADPVVGSRIVNPRGAEVHLAVAPHGQVEGNQVPSQIKEPIGSMDFWWMAVFA